MGRLSGMTVMSVFFPFIDELIQILLSYFLELTVLYISDLYWEVLSCLNV